MTRDEVVQTLKDNLNKPVRVNFKDGESFRLTPLTVEDEGFIFDLSSTEDIVNWMSFEEVETVIPETR
jgi:hypothetical protein